MKPSNVALLCGIAFASHLATAAPLTDINQYADRCSAELGAGTGSYMPIGLLPTPGNFSDSQEVPVFWNQKRITFEETDPASGIPHAGTGLTTHGASAPKRRHAEHSPMR
jgi:hypothetical protein